MSDATIECPQCHKSFKLNETLAAPIIEQTRRTFEHEYEEKEAALEERRKAFGEQQRAAEKARKEVEKERAALAKRQEQIDQQIAEQVEEQCSAIERNAIKKAKQKFDEKLAERDGERAELEEQIKEKDEKLAEARKQEVEFRRKQRELDDMIKAADVEVEKRVAEAIAPERDKAKKEAEEQQRLRIAERDKTIGELQQKLEEAIRKAEQGSQRIRGEVQELDLEATLRSAFPRDTIEEVAKGQTGADILHRVLGNVGQVCGSILWESKRTIRWNDGWLAKLREDQRAAKAEIAVIVSDTMPQGIDHFEQLDGVWVSTLPLAVPLAMALRAGLVETSTARCASEGQQTKMAILYQYLTGPQFKQRVQAIFEGFKALKDDLESEKRATLRRWATKEKQLELVMLATTGMYGDLQGIAGKTLPEIEGLDVPLFGQTEPSTQGN
ncbi:MAG TPA: DUF2130 domain-containing protein [Tepidisphaeraceae bacterium]|nr:DUF2130 domain-containing protein [Tepidisphaeraceae bacterium]